jgi:hypothetical protein
VNVLSSETECEFFIEKAQVIPTINEPLALYDPALVQPIHIPAQPMDQPKHESKKQKLKKTKRGKGKRKKGRNEPVNFSLI